jgi:predicted alpha/beta hydrolase family esterase
MSRVQNRRSVPRKLTKAAGPPKARKAREKLRTKAGAVAGPRPSNVEAPVRSVVFVQGGGRDVHDSWDNKLVASLEQALGPGYAVRYPRMPNEGAPDPAAWKRAIARELRKLSDAVLVAHSVGAAILLDFLADSELDRRFSGVFLIAPPFIGDGGWPSPNLRSTRDLVAALPDGVPFHIYQGSRDATVPVSHSRLFQKVLPQAKVHRLAGRDHQLDGDLGELARDIKLLE